MADDIQPRIEAKYNGRQEQISICGDGVQIFRLYAGITFALSSEIGMPVDVLLQKMPELMRLYIQSLSQHIRIDGDELRRQCGEGSHG